ncbi:hypothetical protein MKX03_017952 [Papaver bracteatum]|nr:hypothetical protein MKX03_017952 [Papaver bracteatum]
MMKPQWYLKCDGMAKKDVDVVVDANCKKIEIIPKKYTAEWRRWLEKNRDWRISRKLWWGHRVPAWYVTLEDDINQEFGAYADYWVVRIDEEEAGSEAEALSEANRIFGGGKQFQVTQDPDVLDTWFSSGIFPFGDVPFRNVYLHPMVRDAHGRKMSKSLGNVIDPLEVINGATLENLHKRLEEGNLDPNELVVAKEGQEKDFRNGIAQYGADALRFALVSYTDQYDKINLDIERVVGYIKWCKKLWNVIRFAMTYLGDNYVPPTSPLNLESLPFSCKWILSVLNKDAISKTVAALESYEFYDASVDSTAVNSWWKYQLCDVFIESIKPYFAGDDEKLKSERCAICDTLCICLDNGLRLLHQFMPYITEELWQRLPQNSPKNESIMIHEYPSTVMEWTNEEVEREMVLVNTILKSFRDVCAGLPPNERLERKPGLLVCKTGAVRDVIRSREFEISTFAMSTLGYSQKTPREIQEKNVEKLEKLRKQLNDIYTSIHNIFTKKMRELDKQHSTSPPISHQPEPSCQ